MSIRTAKEVLKIEAQAIKGLSRRLDANFTKAVDLIAHCRGRVIVTGMGKTGIVARKIAATLSSTGTPSLFMHSTEAVHGDLGQVTPNDIVIIVTYSGETEETKSLIPIIKKIGSTIIAMTGNKNSDLAKHAEIVLDVAVKKEGCPLELAPMASTTATLAMGDALAACLIVRKNFRKEDFALYHPGGNLGKKLLLKVEDIMRTGAKIAKVKEETTIKNVLLAVTRARCGSACIVDHKDAFVGIFTDGDLRRHIETDAGLLERKAKDVMTKRPTVIRQDKLAVEALKIMQDRKIDELPVVSAKGKLVGLLDIQDLIRVGIF
jgi:arabinose-5-phosphate isomerase